MKTARHFICWLCFGHTELLSAEKFRVPGARIADATLMTESGFWAKEGILVRKFDLLFQLNVATFPKKYTTTAALG